jgi:hypothetical protein
MRILKSYFLCLLQLIIDGYRNSHKPSVKLVSRWHPPLSCSTDESIKQIAFDDEHIVLAISHSKVIPKNRLEFRSRGMLVLGHIVLDESISFFSMSLLSTRDGWLLSHRKSQNESRHFILIDRKFVEHKQKILSSQNIENISIFNDSLKGKSLAIYRKRTDVQASTAGKQKLILNLYEMREEDATKYIHKK